MLSKWSVEHPVAAVMLVLSFVALGLISVLRVGMELYPRFDFPAVSVTTIYPGASPADVEDKVTKVIEEAVGSVPGVQQVQSDSSENVSNVSVMLAYGTNVQESLNKIRNEIDKAKRVLPAGIESPAAAAFNLSAMPVISAALYGDLSLAEISKYAINNVENKLKQVNGVASVDVAGISENQIVIDLDPTKMKELEITAEQIQGAISLYELSMPLGKIESSDKSLSIRLSNSLHNIDFIKNIIVRPYVSYDEMPSQQEIARSLKSSIQRQVGSQLAAMQQLQLKQMQQRTRLPGVPGMAPPTAPVRQPAMKSMTFRAPNISPKKKSLPQVSLSQIAQISYKATTPDVVSRINGKPAVRINIRKSDDSNTVDVADEVKDRLSKEKSSFPKGMDYEIFSDQSTEVQSSVGGTARGAMYAAILATIVLMVFLRSIRSTLIIALSIPASVIATFMVIYFGGYTLNMVTLGGLALGIGMLVDNSIVVLENIFRLMEDGVEAEEAAKIGGREVSAAITASTFTSIGVFLPILFISGMAKEWLGPLAVVVISSLAFSLLVALTLVPMLAAKFYRSGTSIARKPKKAMNLKDIYEPVVNLAINYKYAVVLVMLAAVGITGYVATSIGSNLMPNSSSQELIFVNAEMPAAASQASGLVVAKQIEEKILGLKDVKNTNASVGSQISSMGQKPPMVSINAWLKDDSSRKEKLDKLVDKVRNDVRGIKGPKEIIVRGGSAGIFGANQSAIAISIAGPSLETLEDLTKQYQQKIASVKGIESITSSLDETKPEYLVSVNNKLAMEDSVSMASIAELIRIATHGKEITRLKNGSGEQDKIVLKMSKASNDLNQIRNIPIQAKEDYQSIGKYISIIEGKSLKSIFRTDRNRTMTLFVDIDKEKFTISDKVKEIEDAVKSVKLPEGYSYSFGGEVEDMAEVFGQMGQAMILAVILIYMLMAAQFGSLKNPFIIMFTVPLAAIGVVFGLKVSDTPFSMIVFLGSITLTGIVVNNGIVLIDLINILRDRGITVREAIVQASLQRVRPILMTAATTVLAMTPVALHIGGKQMMAPMAVAIMGGLTFSTMLSLVFIPALYSILNRDAKLEVA